MGALAFWGGVSGGAKGVQSNVEHERKVDMEKLREMREARIETLRQKGANTRSEAQIEGAGERVDAQILGQQSARTAQDTAAMERQMQGQEFDASESALDRSSDERQAGARGGSSNKGFAPIKHTTEEEGEDAEGRFFKKSSSYTTFFANKVGVEVRQDPDKGILLMEGATKKGLKGASKEALDNLRKNPTTQVAKSFLFEYKYIPMKYGELIHSQEGATNAELPQPGQGGVLSQGQEASGGSSMGDELRAASASPVP
jgi:hypothetical protein